MKLVIVESPTKCKAIGNYLGKNYKVVASKGHIRDLAICGKGGLGVDVNHDFKPTYKEYPNKEKEITELKKLVKEADEVILATDPDREGEAIARHLTQVLDLPIETTKRLEFHEITKDSILKAIKNPRIINMNIVNSQEARRITDRFIGFPLSTILRSKIKSDSAGRVQSVTLEFIANKENEIKSFISKKYWVIKCEVEKGNETCELNLYSFNDKKFLKKEDKENIDESLANEIINKTGNSIKVKEIKKQKNEIKPQEPFRTSTLQQDAFTAFHFSIDSTMKIAQQLYEGIEINGELTGLITYMRTDSTRLSDVFVESLKDKIIKDYGDKYLCNDERIKNIIKGKNITLMQDGHEAIRPTSLLNTPTSVKSYLDQSQFKLYKIIYDRTLSSLMANQLIETTTTNFENNGVEYVYKTNKTIFDGFTVLKNSENKKIIEFSKDEILKVHKIDKQEKNTEPPSRYTEASVVKLMEESGIGRPSTYSATIKTLYERDYIENKKGLLYCTDKGILTVNVLKKYFKDLMDVNYTKEMESSLDKIQSCELDKVKYLKTTYDKFNEDLEKAKTQMYDEYPKKTDEVCPKCGGEILIKYGKYGEYKECEKCKYKPGSEKKEVEYTGNVCPKCGKPLVYRYKKQNNEKFIGCSNFPTCKYTENIYPEHEEKTCPDCGTNMVFLKGKGKKISWYYHCPNCNKNESFKK